MTDNYIHFEKVTKAFGTLVVIQELDLGISRGEFVSLLGPSGSGKTTLLMLLAGFERASSGAVSVGGHRVDVLPPHRRNMGVVFQNYALFPHMTVAQNVAFPLQMRGVAKAARKEKVDKALDMVQLGTLKERRPSQLSGGQQQRVALARALVFEPNVVLMDEPLGALDKQLREQMQLDIRALHKRLELTIVFVTHDQAEALTMSDRIAIFNQGKIEQIATPVEIYDRPQSRFVAEFIGETNLIEGTVERIDGGKAVVSVANGGRLVVDASPEIQPNGRVTVSIRPEAIRLGGGSGGEDNRFQASVLDSVYHGDHQRVMVDGAGRSLIVRTDRRSGLWSPGVTTEVSFAPGDCWVIGQ